MVFYLIIYNLAGNQGGAAATQSAGINLGAITALVAALAGAAGNPAAPANAVTQSAAGTQAAVQPTGTSGRCRLACTPDSFQLP